MSPERRPGLDRAELIMLAGAVVAPFNSYFEFHIGGLPLLIWGFIAALVVIAVDRWKVLVSIDGPVLALWAMLLFVLLATALATPAEYKPYGIADVVVLLLNLAGFTAIRCYYVVRPEAWSRFFVALATSSVIMSFALVVRALIAANSGQAMGEDSYVLGLGTIVGTYTATFAAASAAAAVFATSRRVYAFGLVAFVVHGVAALLALARGPWLAFLIAMIVVMPIAAWRFRGRFAIKKLLLRAASLLVALPAVAGTMFVVSPLVQELVAQRFFQLVTLDSGTGWSRLIMWQAFLRDALSSPVFGHGAGAYREISQSMGVQDTVSENFVVEIFHAGGGVSVVLLLVGLAGIMRYCLLQPGASRRPAHTAACLAGGVALIVGSMTNPAAWNGLFWVLLGIVATRPLAEEDFVPAFARSTGRNAPVGSTRSEVVPSAGG